jgi:hypothetical protein
VVAGVLEQHNPLKKSAHPKYILHIKILMHLGCTCINISKCVIRLIMNTYLEIFDNACYSMRTCDDRGDNNGHVFQSSFCRRDMLYELA